MCAVKRGTKSSPGNFVVNFHVKEITQKCLWSLLVYRDGGA